MIEKVRVLTPAEKAKMLNEGFNVWDIFAYEHDMYSKKNDGSDKAITEVMEDGRNVRKVRKEGKGTERQAVGKQRVQRG
jgi:hypothetical protein